MTTHITDIIAEAIAAAQERGGDAQVAAVEAARGFEAGLHAADKWKPDGNVVGNLVVKLVLDTSELDAAIADARSRADATSATDVLGACAHGPKLMTVSQLLEAAELAISWGSATVAGVRLGLPLPDFPLPLLMLLSNPEEAKSHDPQT